MSFTTDIKNELGRVKTRAGCCRAAERAITFALNNVRTTTGESRQDAQLTTIELFPRAFANKKCCARAILRGAFLAAGSISDPKKLYQLEITCKNSDLAYFVADTMIGLGLNPKTMERADCRVVYIKDGDCIVDFLRLTGAHNSLMALENTRIFKDVRNNVNRSVNCETANLEKTVVASLRQIANIIYINETAGFDSLPKGLRDVAKARVANREISLRDLGQTLVPPLGKSGVNHRLRKLDAIAEHIRSVTPRVGSDKVIKMDNHANASRSR